MDASVRTYNAEWIYTTIKDDEVNNGDMLVGVTSTVADTKNKQSQIARASNKSL